MKKGYLGEQIKKLRKAYWPKILMLLKSLCLKELSGPNQKV